MCDRWIGNRGGIPFVVATQTVAGDADTNAVYTLPNHIFRFAGSVGIIVVHADKEALNVPGVTIKVNDSTLALSKNDGSPVTSVEAADYAVVFNKFLNTLKVL